MQRFTRRSNLREGFRQYGGVGSGGVSILYWVLPGIYTPEAAQALIFVFAKYRLSDPYYGGPGAAFAERHTIRYSRTRTLVTQRVGMDI